MGSNLGLAIFFSFFSPKWDKKWVLACQSFGECTARVKLELTDFNWSSKNCPPPLAPWLQLPYICTLAREIVQKQLFWLTFSLFSIMNKWKFGICDWILWIMQRSNSGRKRTRSDPDGSVLLNTRVGWYRISGEKIVIDILKFEILRGEYNRPFNLHLDFWKSRSWEIKVCFKP